LVGRRDEVAGVRRLLSWSRLVTLTGVGGVGKSRLALRVAAEARRSFADGVWLAELAALPGPALLAETLADAVGVRAGPARDPADALYEHLASRELLLVVDDCEHLLPACGVLLADILRACPRVRIIATSRELLNVPGEQVFPVEPLDVPAWDASITPDRVADYPGLALFAERAALARTGFTITAENVRQVARICRRLDGLPLAIELAAARLRAVSAAELAHRIDDRFGVLNTGPAGAAPRHQTLRAAVEWSFLLCGKPERLLWMRASVFTGLFELAAAEQVCAGGELPVAGVMEAVSGLVSKSVLIATEGAGDLRYRMLGTIRAYGLDRLRSGECGEPGDHVQLAGDPPGQRPAIAEPAETELRERHTTYYRDLAERFAASWFGPRQAQWSERLRLALPNLRAVLAYCLATPGQEGVAVQIAGALGPFWSGFGEIREGATWLERALDAAPGQNAAALRAQNALGRIRLSQGRHDEAHAIAVAAVTAARENGDAEALADALSVLGLALSASDPARAAAVLDEAIAVVAAPPQQARALLYRAITALHSDDAGLAHTLIGRCRAISAAHGDRLLLGHAIGCAVAEALNGGDTARAGEYARLAVPIHQNLRNTLGLATSLEQLAWTAAAAGDHRRAARLLGASERETAEVGGTSVRSPRFALDHDGCISAVMAALGDEAFTAESRRGAALSPPELLRFAVAPDNDRAAGRPRQRRPGQPGRSPLTRREQQVASLVAEGLSNREIAARLVLSTRTAEGHVENILIKLGFGSRTQIARWHGRRED
jgi:non-specific serine/threonine protein kinase